jgi:hypothetical protein
MTVTRYIAQLGNPVWVKIGVGWCAGIIIGIRRDHAIVKFLTGAREKVTWTTAMRFRNGEEQPHD